MADALPLLVPISMRALLVNERVRNEGVFARWTKIYSNLNDFVDAVPPPFGNQENKVQLGVHLHWKLPWVLTHGEADKGSTQVQFKYTPNRWLIARFASQVNSTNPQQLTA